MPVRFRECRRRRFVRQSRECRRKRISSELENWAPDSRDHLHSVADLVIFVARSEDFEQHLEILFAALRHVAILVIFIEVLENTGDF